jgi:hypothetical protein
MDRPWKQAERAVAQLLGGTRYAANTGGPVDVESATVVCQVKHRARASLAELEAWAIAVAREGAERHKVGVLVAKRRAGCGRPTPWLFVLTESAWQRLTRPTADPNRAPGALCDSAAPPRR